MSEDQEMTDMYDKKLVPDILEKVDKVMTRYLDVLPRDIELPVQHAFIWDGNNRRLMPVSNPVRIDLKDLVGIDDQKKVVIDNTKKFVGGVMANNILLWGERGTGKSSLIKAMMKLFERRKMRMIQVYPHDILTIRWMYDLVSSNLDYRFIIFIDDLSFEEDSTDYKEMKNIMDGGLEQIPENLLFYATSNRKHLISEKFSDMSGDEIRPSDTVEEKLSLADRFGIRLGFYHFSQELYLDAVDLYAKKYGAATGNNLHRSAIQWALEAGGRNGRIAEQFVRNFLGGGRK